MNKIYLSRISSGLPLLAKIPLCIVAVLPFALGHSIMESILFAIPFFIAITAHEGILLDFDKRRLKIYFSIFGIKVGFGKWQSMPVYNRITVVPITGTRKMETLRSANTYEYSVTAYIVRLYDTTSYDYQIASKGTKEKVRNDAARLSQLTHIPVEDYTESH